MKKEILARLVMLVFFSLSITLFWAAFSMVFDAALWNILLGVVGAFFLFRTLEIADRINHFGPYSENKHEEQNEPHQHYPGPRFGAGANEETAELEEND